MPKPGGLTSGPDLLEDPAVLGGATEDELAGPDLGLEHSQLYAVLVLALVAGSLLLRGEGLYRTGYTLHSIMETVATVLAFIIGALALVRYYSRKQATFLLIGCGFLGAALLDLNHAFETTPRILDVKVLMDSRVSAEGLFMWTWTSERVFLSLFLFVSLLTWRQEAREGPEEVVSEVTVYVTALAIFLSNLFFFQYVPLEAPSSTSALLSRPTELIPASLFGLAFIGFYRKGSWRRDQFEHWMLVFLLISTLAHAGFMTFSRYSFDAMFDVAHLLKITSYLAILTGLMSSVHATFTREARVLEALTATNEALANEARVRAKTERAVLESSARLQSFIDDANDLIQRIGPDGRFLYVNRAWKRVLGYTDEHLEQMKLMEMVHPQHRANLESEFRWVMEGGEPRRFNVEYLSADGRVVIMSGSTQAQFVDGRPVATQSIFRDVTEQRLAERRLDESQRNLEALVENTGDSIWSVDQEHRLITLNSAFSLAMEARTGIEPEVGQLPAQVFAPEDVEWYRELYDRTLSGERQVAVRSDDVDGDVRYFELYANPIHSLEGASGAVFFGKDVTPRVRAEEALRISRDEAEAANKAKSDFLANMSHELRTPLNSVIGFTNILLKNKEEHLNEKEVGYLQRVLSNGKHLLALINEVLDLAKVESGRMELIIEDIDLAHLCVETVQQLEGQAKAKKEEIALLSEVPESVYTVETDSAKLKQVIINLVGNALKFTHEGSVIVRLDMAPDGKTPVAISVIDTGIGIPKDRLEAIFEAFQQAEAGTSRKYGGTGLGLALSRSICLLLGYDLIVESEVGKGSTFKIVMGERAERPVMEQEREPEKRDAAVPVAATASESTGVVGALPDSPSDASRETTGAEVAAAGAEGSSTHQARPSWSDFKVLVVDDEKDSRVLIEHFLEEFGCQVFTATGGEEGLELARKHKPDLITLDLVMPELNGWEVLKRLKADPDLRTIPVVVVSVVANEGHGRLLGAVDLITKPFEREDLLRVLWKNLGRQRGGRILLMVHDKALEKELGEIVTARGLEVSTGGGGELMSILGHEAPDAVVLDLDRPDVSGISAILELRDDRIHTGLPVLVLTPSGLDEREREIVGELATVHSEHGKSADALRHLLDASFPRAGTQEAGK